MYIYIYIYIPVQTWLVSISGTDISTCGEHFQFNNHDLFENVDWNQIS